MSNGPPPAEYDGDDILAELRRCPIELPSFATRRRSTPQTAQPAPASGDAVPEEATLEEIHRLILLRWGFRDALPASDATLQALHSAYLMNVPFENATKLIRMTRTRSADRARRTPREFWADHLRHGTGGTCFAAAAAFRALLEQTGFTCRTIFCRLPGEGPRAHTALLVDTDKGVQLVDVGYALPAPVPLPKGFATRRRTAYYDAEIRKGPDGGYLVLTTDDRGTRFRYGFSTEAASPEAVVTAWNATFDPRAKYMRNLALGRFTTDSRYLYKAPDRLYLISRTKQREVHFDPPGLSMLAAVFRIPVDILTMAAGALERERRRAGGS